MGLLLHDVLGDVPGAGARSRVTSPLQTRPFRTVLLWQAVATAAVAAVAGVWAGGNAALSAVLGGVVNLAADVVYAFALGLMRPTGPGGAVIAAVRAEASKILRDHRAALAGAGDCTGTSCWRRSSPRSWSRCCCFDGVCSFATDESEQDSTMAAGTTNSPTEYIQHHLTFLAKPVGEAGGFWTLHVDTRRDDGAARRARRSASSGSVTRKATAGVPSKTQAFVELARRLRQRPGQGHLPRRLASWSRRSR